MYSVYSHSGSLSTTSLNKQEFGKHGSFWEKEKPVAWRKIACKSRHISSSQFSLNAWREAPTGNMSAFAS